DVASGQLVRRFPTTGAVARSQTLAFTLDGQRLITGHHDCTALVWELPPSPAAPLTAADITAAWADLAGADVAKGFAAVCRLADDPKQAIPLFKEKLRPVSLPPTD